jgi:carbon monoxide dehydrogenase subunit G
MKLQDTFVIEAPVEQVWTFLLDIPRVRGWVPGTEGVEVAEPNVFRGI